MSDVHARLPAGAAELDQVLGGASPERHLHRFGCAGRRELGELLGRGVPDERPDLHGDPTAGTTASPAAASVRRARVQAGPVLARLREALPGTPRPAGARGAGEVER